MAVEACRWLERALHAGLGTAAPILKRIRASMDEHERQALALLAA